MEPRACLDILFTVHNASETPTNYSERDFLRWQFENKLICITMPASTTKQMYADDRRAFETDQRWTAIDTYTTSYPCWLLSIRQEDIENVPFPDDVHIGL